MSINNGKNNTATDKKRAEGEKYKCKRKTQHIRLNIIDSPVGPNYSEWNGSLTDPLGSYTGVPVNRFEKPVQDVDDL